MGLLARNTDLQVRNKVHIQESNTDCKQDIDIHIQPAAEQVYRMDRMALPAVAAQAVLLER
jgi:uncharacterized protein (UPF0276 family)